MPGDKFIHDCDDCIYLGETENNMIYDLYFCPTEPTVIARYGNDGPAYISGIAFVAQVPALMQAFNLAYSRGLIEVKAVK